MSGGPWLKLEGTLAGGQARGGGLCMVRSNGEKKITEV